MEADLAHVKVLGIPRGLLYYRYGTLWETFFSSIGLEVIVSPETDKDILDVGNALSVDECCLASKAFMGHVDALADRCDAVFVPTYASGTPRMGFCTKFQSVADVTRNTFRDKNLEVVSCLINSLGKRNEARKAFVELAGRFGVSPVNANKAWNASLKALRARNDSLARKQEETLKAVGDDPDALTILVAAHPYLAHDDYMAGAVIDALESMGATVLYADETDHKRTRKESLRFSDTMPWVVNRELIGSILLLQDKVDGIVLISAFPCGPDSMTNDAVMRLIKGKPILNLMIDAQSGTAGIETRVESFIDILRFQKKGGYIHD